jgi:hypothetical protein
VASGCANRAPVLLVGYGATQRARREAGLGAIKRIKKLGQLGKAQIVGQTLACSPLQFQFTWGFVAVGVILDLLAILYQSLQQGRRKRHLDLVTSHPASRRQC